MEIIENGPDLKVTTVDVPTMFGGVLALKSSLENDGCYPMFSREEIKKQLLKCKVSSALELYQKDEVLYTNVVFQYESLSHALWIINMGRENV